MRRGHYIHDVGCKLNFLRVCVNFLLFKISKHSFWANLKLFKNNIMKKKLKHSTKIMKNCSKFNESV